MIKLKITRSDGVVIEAEGPAEELQNLDLVPAFWPAPLQQYQPDQTFYRLVEVVPVSTMY
jgi:hypothetical protein